MMNSSKRGRGRPIGTGKDDTPTLNKVADLMAADPRLKVTPAIRQVLGNPDAATVRRLQVKWQTGRDKHLAAAQDRRSVASMSARRVAPSYSPRMVRQIAEAQRKVSGMLGTGTWENSTSAALRAAYDEPGMKAMREVYDSPAMRAARTLYDDPTMRAMRELHDSPTMRAMRELQGSPTMRAALEAAQEVARIQRLIKGGF